MSTPNTHTYWMEGGSVTVRADINLFKMTKRQREALFASVDMLEEIDQTAEKVTGLLLALSPFVPTSTATAAPTDPQVVRFHQSHRGERIA